MPQGDVRSCVQPAQFRRDGSDALRRGVFGLGDQERSRVADLVGVKSVKCLQVLVEAVDVHQGDGAQDLDALVGDPADILQDGAQQADPGRLDD